MNWKHRNTSLEWHESDGMAIDVCGKCRESKYSSKPTPLKQTQLQTFDSILFSNIWCFVFSFENGCFGCCSCYATTLTAIAIAYCCFSISPSTFSFIFFSPLPPLSPLESMYLCTLHSMLYNVHILFFACVN